MSDEPGWTPEQYDSSRDALAYLNVHFQQLNDAVTPEQVMQTLIDETGSSTRALAHLVAGMANIAHVLMLMRFKETEVLPSQTFEELGRIFTPPGE